ncbi:MAG: metallophosphoesterase [Ignavibacteriales bacterium]|nr:metallophosphoesterase [Ignavibacteriales bacterium]
MRSIAFILFFTLFFAIYGLINYYILIRGYQSLSQNSFFRPYYLILFIIISLSFFIGRILENYWLNPVSRTFVWIGAFWLAAILYFIIGILLLDFIRLLNHFFSIYPTWVRNNYESVKGLLGGGVLVIVLSVLGFGYWNATVIQIKNLHYVIKNKSAGLQQIKIVSMSDIHLGSIIGKSKFDAIVEKINSLNSDIVLLPGDILDEDLAPVIKENVGESLRKIESRYGIFAVTGNHEYIGGVEEACKYLESNNVRVLRDEAVNINNTLYLIGREDRSINRFGKKKRISLNELMKPINKSYPVVLMDHQPFDLQEAAHNGIDLQLSGHTHHGQLWPLNFITEMVYEVSWGEESIGNTLYYVSCGVGTWGPPVRTGNRPEIVQIILDFQNS